MRDGEASANGLKTAPSAARKPLISPENPQARNVAETIATTRPRADALDGHVTVTTSPQVVILISVAHTSLIWIPPYGRRMRIDRQTSRFSRV